MRVYLSGWHASRAHHEKALIEAGVLRYRCYSFPNLVKVQHKKFATYTYMPPRLAAYDVDVKHKVGIMMDSGGHSCHQWEIKHGELIPPEVLVEPYIEYCKQQSKHWDFYMTMDLETNASKIYRMQKFLVKRGLNPVPVYHGDDHTDYLKRYVDLGAEIIAIASPAHLRSKLVHKRRFLDTCFNEAAKLGFKIHGLAMTSVWQMLAYDYFAVDSSSWSRCASTGCIMKFDEQRARVSTVHVSVEACSRKIEMSADMRRRLRREVEDEGYDFRKLRTDFVERHRYNAATMQKIADAAERHHRGAWRLLF